MQSRAAQEPVDKVQPRPPAAGRSRARTAGARAHGTASRPGSGVRDNIAAWPGMAGTWVSGPAEVLASAHFPGRGAVGRWPGSAGEASSPDQPRPPECRGRPARPGWPLRPGPRRWRPRPGVSPPSGSAAGYRSRSPWPSTRSRPKAAPDRGQLLARRTRRASRAVCIRQRQLECGVVAHAASPFRNSSRCLRLMSRRRPALTDPSCPVRIRSFTSSRLMPSAAATSSGL